MAEERTFNLAASQIGRDNSVDTWVEEAVPFLLTQTNLDTVGIKFHFNWTMSTDDNRSRGPDRLFTATADGLAVPAVAVRPLTITVTTDNTFIPTTNFFMIKDNVNIPFSNTNLPFGTPDGSGWKQLATTTQPASNNNRTIHTWSWQIDETLKFQNGLEDPLGFKDHMNNPLWDGNFSFVWVLPALFNSFNITDVRLSGQLVPFWTGTPTLGSDKRDRVVLDDRFGMPTYAGDLVEDGNLHGRFVRAADWDPEIEEADYPGSILEGDTDDLPVE